MHASPLFPSEPNGCGRDVRVIKDDGRGLAGQFQADPLELLAGDRGDAPPGPGWDR
jgi:hypothetical protein